MRFLLGKKMEMTQVFQENGTVVPVTLVQAGPCIVTSIKENAQGKTTAVLGFGAKKHALKPQAGEWKELGSFALTREFPTEEDDSLERGQTIDMSAFEVGKSVNVTGVSKGKGFQGVVKRHGFHGSPASHGHKDQLRMPGSIGAQGPQRVFKGTKMGGRMGGDTVTIKNLEIIQIDQKNNIIAIKGAVPGARNGFVTLMSTEGDVWRK